MLNTAAVQNYGKMHGRSGHSKLLITCLIRDVIDSASTQRDVVMQVAHRYETHNETSKHRAVNAMAVTSEDCMIAGCSDGCMLVYAPRTASIQSRFNLGAAPMQSLQTDNPST